MSKNPKGRRRRPNPNQHRRLRVRGVRRSEPDLRRLGRVLIELAQAEAEAAAQADHEHREQQVADEPEGEVTS